MNRRNFLKTAVAAGMASLVPSWLLAKERTPVDLSAFCWQGRGEPTKYKQIVRPFVQYGTVDDEIGRKPWQQKLGLPGSHAELFRYATDQKICIRVPGAEADRTDAETADLPNAMGLPWTHDWPCRGKWLKWPGENHLLAADTDCPECQGYGCKVGMDQECQGCEGMGQVCLSYPKQCRECKGEGHVIKEPCPACGGDNAIGVFPGIQPIGNGFIGVEFDRKIRTHLRDVEWFLPEAGVDGGNKSPLKFRFSGGVGLLVPLVTDHARRRIEAAKEAS